MNESDHSSMDKLSTQDSKDYLYALAKGSVGAIPFAGSIASEFFSLMISPPLQKRMDKWFNDLYSEVEQLKKTQEAYKTENLEKNEAFISALTSATQIVIKTHYDEKIKVLKNAVLNSVIQKDKNFQQGVFLDILNSINTNHIKILQKYYETSGGSTVESLFEEVRNINRFMKVDDGDYHLLVFLETKGLIERDYSILNRNPRAPLNPNTFYVKISPLGKDFYEFLIR